MKSIRYVCLAIAMLCAAAETQPVEGTWEGELNGIKAVSLSVHENKGAFEGSIDFTVMINDDGEGPKVAGHDVRKLVESRWDGKSLHFTVGAPGFDPDDPNVRFTLTITGDRKANLTRLDRGEMTMAVSRVN
jgi:hypothetical protein